MSKPRFQFTYATVSTFADRLRLGDYVCPVTNRFHLSLGPDDPATADLEQAPVTIDLPKKDAAAYRRAAAAFNVVMDEHERKEKAKNARRRQLPRRTTDAAPARPLQ